MAIRYCGDLEVHVSAEGRSFRVTIKWPARGQVYKSLYCEKRGHAKQPTPAEVDRVASRAIKDLMRAEAGLPVEKRTGMLVVRRVFQAPCPR